MTRSAWFWVYSGCKPVLTRYVYRLRVFRLRRIVVPRSSAVSTLPCELHPALMSSPLFTLSFDIVWNSLITSFYNVIFKERN